MIHAALWLLSFLFICWLVLVSLPYTLGAVLWGMRLVAPSAYGRIMYGRNWRIMREKAKGGRW